MANTLTELGRQNLLEADIDWLVATMKCSLTDLDTDDTGNKVVTDATNATPIVITTSVAHGWATGDLIAITGVGGNTAANGNWTMTNVSATTFSLDTSVGNGVYTSGGVIWRYSDDEFLAAYSAGKVGTDQTITTPTSTNGVADGDNLTYTSVSGNSVELLMIHRFGTGDADSETLLGIDTATGLPVTPNGGDITVTWNASGIFKV